MTSRPVRTCLLAVLALAAPLAPASAAPPADLQLVPVATGLELPLGVVAPPDGSGRLFVLEQPGRVRVVRDGVLLATPFLDLTALIGDASGEKGLLGLAFDPAYASNRRVYVVHTRIDGATVLASYLASAADPDRGDAGTRDVLMLQSQPFGNHNGGHLAFGPDGHLYLGLGDGGSGGDPGNNAQDIESLLGKMLRIDVDGDDYPADDSRDYAIPPDNPFSDGFGADEIWAYGLRNPWRWSFDSMTGDLWIGDVGQNEWEEVSRQPAASAGGENYGWDCYEGSQLYEDENSGTICAGPVVFPVLEYSSAAEGGGRCSVTGGFVYRGHRVAGLRGTYVFGDFCTGEVFLGTGAGDAWEMTLWQNTPHSIPSFGETADGELLLVHRGQAGEANGAVFLFLSPSTVFVDDFESGGTAAWSANVP